MLFLASHGRRLVGGACFALGAFSAAILIPAPALFAQAVPLTRPPGAPNGLTAAVSPAASAATPEAPPSPLTLATQKFRHGEYEDALADAQKGLKSEDYNDEWWCLVTEILLTTGKYEDAYKTSIEGLRNVPSSIRLRLLAREASLYTHNEAEAQQILNTTFIILDNLNNRMRYIQQPPDPDVLVAAGQAELLRGADARTVLQRYFQPAEQRTPAYRDAFLTAGKLALDKHDYRVASRAFGQGLQAFPGDADLLWGMAMAFRDSDREKYADYAQMAMASNPQHIPTMLMLAENLIDAESYDQARSALNDILKINPRQPEALALLSSIAALKHQTAQADEYRSQALATWRTNPKVDHIIGQKLSRNYRFTLGAAAQARVLSNNPDFAPARVQLAQDLLRLGLEEDAWALAAKANQDDPYDIEAFNLVTLRDLLAKYTTISTPHFNLRMSPEEARVYSGRVLDLLNRVRTQMTAKYGLNLNQPTTVEIFPDPRDFSVRTFGMPDIGEFLGVTFGPVVTINSPGTHESDWEDVLWHEFVHVITLTATRNQMPRWLSEGISVYEEHAAKPSWGQLMSPTDRERILAGKMQPISSMSAAFIQAKEPGDTQFAYFESYLIVQFLVERYGMERMRALLADLGKGVDINDAFSKYYIPIAELDKEFAAYATGLAEKYGGGFNFKPLKSTGGGEQPVAAVADDKNFNIRYAKIDELIQAEKWEEARKQLQEVLATGLYIPGPENPYLVLAKVSAKLNDTAGEKAALRTVAEHEADSLAAISRLLEIAQNEKDYAGMYRWGNAWISIHPMAPGPWRALLTANEQMNNRAAALEAGLALLELDPPDLASVHYRVAKQMQPTDAAGARRHVLMALEEAPRFRAAYELLLTLPAGSPVPETPRPAAP